MSVCLYNTYFFDKKMYIPPLSRGLILICLIKISIEDKVERVEQLGQTVYSRVTNGPVNSSAINQLINDMKPLT